MKAKYIRVSSKNQNTERQINNNYIQYIDVCSGAIPFTDRKQASKLITDIEKGKITEVIFHSIDRAGRNTIDVLSTMQYLKQNNVSIFIENQNLSSHIEGKPNPIFDLIINVMSSISELERNTIKERTIEGIKIAKSKGVYKGRALNTTETIEQLQEKYTDVIKDIQKNRYSYSELQKMHSISRPTVSKLIKLFSPK